MKKVDYLLAGACLIGALNACCKAETLNIRIFSDIQPLKILISAEPDQYAIYGDGLKADLQGFQGVMQLTAEGDTIQLQSPDKKFSNAHAIMFTGNTEKNKLQISSLIPAIKPRIYDDNILVVADHGTLVLFNNVFVEDYTAGVVEAESGYHSNSEFYKVQAILCRTYALSNYRRHEAEGYQLCDLVHCQVYKGRSTKTVIIEATKTTEGMVIVDSELKLITAAFHSNCGGETMNSEDVWSLSTTYLKCIKDSFCLRQPHATWEKKITASEWQNYLALKKSLFPYDSTLISLIARDGKNTDRENYFWNKEVAIPLKFIRSDWQLRSAFFKVEVAKDSVLFRGRGYGHGIGLCQEGAMDMAARGYSYKEILHFYYKDIHLVNLSVLDFFRDE